MKKVSTTTVDGIKTTVTYHTTIDRASRNLFHDTLTDLMRGKITPKEYWKRQGTKLIDSNDPLITGLDCFLYDDSGYIECPERWHPLTWDIINRCRLILKTDGTELTKTISVTSKSLQLTCFVSLSIFIFMFVLSPGLWLYAFGFTGIASIIIHFCRRRIRRRFKPAKQPEIDPDNDEEAFLYWPFISRQQYETALALHPEFEPIESPEAWKTRRRSLWKRFTNSLHRLENMTVHPIIVWLLLAIPAAILWTCISPFILIFQMLDISHSYSRFVLPEEIGPCPACTVSGHHRTLTAELDPRSDSP